MGVWWRGTAGAVGERFFNATVNVFTQLLMMVGNKAFHAIVNSIG
jgi:hypothetical protein